MSKAKNKTQKTAKSPEDFVAAVKPAWKNEDSKKLLTMMKEITGFAPKMWGPSIVGFGEYHYKYESGREGNMCRAGFSPRAQNFAIYLMLGLEAFSEELSRLGKHKIGKSCLYIKRLSDVDEDVLREILIKDLALMEDKYLS